MKESIGLKVRELFTEGDRARDAGNTIPDDVVRYTDLVYGSDPKWQVLDVYRPKDADGILPVIISYHGGGWVYGNKEVYQWYTMSLAEQGFAVINYTYRLAPEFQFPAPYEDMNLVVKWMLAYAEEYGFDTANVFAVGDSAGAHGLATYANIMTNPVYAANFTFKVPDDFRFNAIGLNCGAYHIDINLQAAPDSMDGMTAALMGEYLPENGSQKELELMQPGDFVTSAFPPSMIMTCDGDPLKNDPPYLIRPLTACGVPFRYQFCVGKKEPLGHVFHCNIKLPEARAFNAEQCRFFRAYLK